MCLIIYKPEDRQIPEDWVLRRAQSNNWDGMGFMINRGGVIVGVKGFNDVDALIKGFELFNISAKDQLMIHFRLATHGSGMANATHPFPLSQNPPELNELYWESDTGLAHNGIILGYGDENYSLYDFVDYVDEESKLSDTQDYILKVLSQECIKNNIQNSSILKLIEQATSPSRWLVMNKTFVSMLGEWYLDNTNGIYHSSLELLHRSKGTDKWELETIDDHVRKWTGKKGYRYNKKNSYTEKHYTGSRFDFKDDDSEFDNQDQAQYECPINLSTDHTCWTCPFQLYNNKLKELECGFTKDMESALWEDKNNTYIPDTVPDSLLDYSGVKERWSESESLMYDTKQIEDVSNPIKSIVYSKEEF